MIKQRRYMKRWLSLGLIGLMWVGVAGANNGIDGTEESEDEPSLTVFECVGDQYHRLQLQMPDNEPSLTYFVDDVPVVTVLTAQSYADDERIYLPMANDWLVFDGSSETLWQAGRWYTCVPTVVVGDVLEPDEVGFNAINDEVDRQIGYPKP